eukprot:CFRG0704T1
MCGASWCKAKIKKENRAVQVPKNIEVRKAWLEKINPDYTEEDLVREIRVCHRHFKPEQLHVVNKYTKVKKGELPMSYEEERLFHLYTEDDMSSLYALPTAGVKRSAPGTKGIPQSPLPAESPMMPTSSGLLGSSLVSEGNTSVYQSVLIEKNTRISALMTECGMYSENNTTLKIENERLRSTLRQMQQMVRQLLRDDAS